MSKELKKLLPKSIKIMGQEYEIIVGYIPNGNVGECRVTDENKRTITINSTLSLCNLNSTFLHEVFHAVLYEISLNQTSLSIDLEEIIVESLSKFMVENWEFKLK